MNEVNFIWKVPVIVGNGKNGGKHIFILPKILHGHGLNRFGSLNFELRIEKTAMTTDSRSKKGKDSAAVL